MALHVDSDVANINMPEERSCYAGHFYIRNWPFLRPVKTTPKINSRIHTECKTIHNMVYSEAEDKTCGGFNNGKRDIGMRPYLIALYHKKPATTLKIENSPTEGF